VKYHGIFASAAKDRSALAALLPPPAPVDAEPAVGERCSATPASLRARRPSWADLIRRVFIDDVLRCSCGGARIITAFIVGDAVARTTLEALGLASEPGRLAPARAPPQLDFDDAVD